MTRGYTIERETKLRQTIVICLFAVAACSGGGRPTGNPAPIGDTTRTVVGRIGYQRLGLDLSERTADGRLIAQPGFTRATFSAPAAYVQVEVLGDDGRVLGSGPVDALGRYSIFANFGINPATPVSLRVTARADLPFGTTLRVHADAETLTPYEIVSGPGGNPGDNRFTVMTVNADVTLEQGAGAFHILKSVYEGFILGRSGLLPGSIMPDVNFLWKPGNGDASFVIPGVTLANIVVAGGVDGINTSNTDVWDDAVLMRLVGQFMLDYFLYEVAPKGEVNDSLLVPSAAWKEGFLDFWSCIGRRSRIYWDTVGSGESARVTRYFDIESFYDHALARLGPDDPNVYQPPGNVGIGSRFSIAEILWDIHDAGGAGTDNDGFNLDPSLTIQVLDRLAPGFSYPYLHTLLEGYESTQTFSLGSIQIMLLGPEDQQISYPATVDNGFRWPVSISPPGRPGTTVRAPFSQTITDTVDTLTPDPVNFEIGEQTQRYFTIGMLLTSDLRLELDTPGDLIVELLTQTNAVIASGPSPLIVPDLPGTRYIVRVRPADEAAPQLSVFDLKIEVTDP